MQAWAGARAIYAGFLPMNAQLLPTGPDAGASGLLIQTAIKRLLFVILSAAKNLFLKPPRFFTPRRSVQNDMNIQCLFDCNFI